MKPISRTVVAAAIGAGLLGSALHGSAGGDVRTSAVTVDRVVLATTLDGGPDDGAGSSGADGADGGGEPADTAPDGSGPAETGTSGAPDTTQATGGTGGATDTGAGRTDAPADSPTAPAPVRPTGPADPQADGTSPGPTTGSAPDGTDPSGAPAAPARTSEPEHPVTQPAPSDASDAAGSTGTGVAGPADGRSGPPQATTTAPGSGAGTPAPGGEPAAAASTAAAPAPTARATRSPAPTSSPADTATTALLALTGASPSTQNRPGAPAPAHNTLPELQYALFRRFGGGLFNQSPAAAPVQTAQSSTGVVTGQLNASDPDRDPLRYTVTGAPARGTVVVGPDGSFTYTPGSDLARTGGTDSFTVTVTDTGRSGPQHRLRALLNTLVGRSDPTLANRLFGPSTVRVVVPVSVAPVAPPVTNVPPVRSEPPTVGTPNASTGAVTGSTGIVDADGDPLTFTATTPPGKGTVVVGADGTYTYTPSDAARHAAASARATDADRTDTFTLTATDPDGGSTAVTITVPIGPRNDVPGTSAPMVDAPDATTGAVTGAVGATDPDGDTLTYTATQGTKGTVVVNPDGTFTYTPSAAARHAAASATATGADRRDTFTVTVDDDHGGTTTVLVSVSITPANEPPTAAVPTVGAPDPATGVVTGTLPVTDADGDTVAFPATVTSVRGGTVVIGPDGSFTYTPTATARHQASEDDAPEFLTRDEFVVPIGDGHGGTTAVTVSVGLAPLNTPPAQAGPPTVGAPDAATGRVTGSLAVADRDGDQPRYPRYVSTAKGGLLVIDPDGSFVYLPSSVARHAAAATGATDADRSDSVTVTVGDGYGGYVDVVVVVPVASQNAPPTTGTTTVGRPASTTGAVTGTLGLTDADRDTLTYTSTQGANGTVVVAPDGTYTYTPTAAARYAANGTPGPDTDSFVVTATDGHGGTTTVTVTVPIDGAPPHAVTTKSAGAVSLGVAVSPDGTRTYVPSGQTVRVYDTATNTELAPLPVANALNVALSPDGRTAYVTSYSLTGGDDRLVVVDTATGAVLGTVPVGRGAQQVTVSPDGTRAYVPNFSDGTLTVIDTASRSVVATWVAGSAPTDVLTSPDGTRLYVVDSSRDGGPGVVTVLDAATGSTAATVTSVYGGAPYRAALTPDGRYLYVVNTDTGHVDESTVTIIDTTTNTVARTLELNQYSYGVAVSPDGSRAYVTQMHGRLLVIDTASQTVVGTAQILPPEVPDGSGTVYYSQTLFGIDVSPDGRFAYVTAPNRGGLVVVDLAPTAPPVNPVV